MGSQILFSGLRIICGGTGRRASHRMSITQEAEPCGHKEGAAQPHAPLLRGHAVPNLMSACADGQLHACSLKLASP